MGGPKLEAKPVVNQAASEGPDALPIATRHDTGFVYFETQDRNCKDDFRKLGQTIYDRENALDKTSEAFGKLTEEMVTKAKSLIDKNCLGVGSNINPGANAETHSYTSHAKACVESMKLLLGAKERGRDLAVPITDADASCFHALRMARKLSDK